MKKKRTLPAVLLIYFLFGIFALSGCGSQPKLSAEETVRAFIDAVRAGDIEKASSYLDDPSVSLTVPQNRLGEAIRQSMKVVSVKENKNDETSSLFTVDVTLQMLDVLQVMSRATMLYLMDTKTDPQKIDPETIQDDQRMAAIYDTILKEDERNPLPVKETLCIFTLREQNGILKIVMDESLANTLEGNIRENLETIRKILRNQQETEQ